ncbi:vesicular-fusion protein NsF [Trypanosoma rangeli]|uniref:Vesicle-fusing ATPase n=1 Tax=Trypanosoma rangeli TaxID=5698 RepID=A0A422NPR7_TRYRA|nr:vesicular-fusion protein NsF [Trypanosoma rangeli]RNF07404.1 vesicular-fusion protein NsF [Trypanosoma rangeli]|eukprot:RNF07404.1 vesicular-fusion protein NsF [Trypanosoma rangeli]
MSVPLIVCSVLKDEDARTNLLYLNPHDADSCVGNSGIVMINDFLFTVSAHVGIRVGHIGMNSIQRRLLGLSVTTGSTVILRTPPQHIPAIAKMLLRVEHIVVSKKGGTLDCMEFITYFIRHFSAQCFRESQMLAVVLDSGLRLLATVTQLDCDGLGSVGVLDPTTNLIISVTEKSEITLTNVPDNQLDAQQPQLMQNFDLESLGIGGLRKEFAQVFRRAFASRLFPASYMKKLGVKHVKGVLLYGPPGTGKTLIARKIGEILNCHPPKIVNGPEVFNKFVGGTEENVRKLFLDAEAEDATKGELSKLHLIIFDEFDAICRQRGAVRDSTGVNDNVVNQLLSKIDGVNSLNNVLLIGMTNRLDLIDEAILRPGRFEVHVEISLPNEEGREEIFRIHTRGMRENGVISKDVALAELASLTKNYSGAEIEGVVRSAISNAFNKHIDLDNPTEAVQVSDVFVSRHDFLQAIEEVQPAFGQAKEECSNLKGGGIICYGKQWEGVESCCERYVELLKGEGKRINLLSVLIEGLPNSGKSAVAAHLAEKAEFPYVKVISSESMVSYGELQKVNIIRKAFEDAYRSPASIIILDDIERIIEFSHLGGRYSNTLLQALLVLIKRPPPEGRKLLVIGTTSLYEILDSLEMVSCFSVKMTLPGVPPSALQVIANDLGLPFATQADLYHCVDHLFPGSMPIKQLLLVLEMSVEKGADGNSVITSKTFEQALESVGLRRS